MKLLIKITFLFCTLTSFVFGQSTKLTDALKTNDPSKVSSGMRKGVTTGYYLGFNSLADEMRELRRSEDLPTTSGFFKSLYIDFHYANQEFNGNFFTDDVATDSSASGEPIENSLYGLTFGFKLGDNPNLIVRVPLSISEFDVGNLDDSGMVSGIELFQNYKIGT